MRTSLALLAAAALAALSCASGGDESPLPRSIEPATGLASAPTRVVIRGDGFLARPSGQQSGGGASVETLHRAWLGDVELEAVTWIDVHTIEATVPAGLEAGTKRLVVENALGRRGALEGAFEVIATGAAVLEVSLATAPATVAVGQPVTVTLEVRNTGATAATTLTPDALELGGAAAEGAGVEGPSPASLERLEPGASATFTWAVTPAVPGALTFSAVVRGVDELTSEDVTSLDATSSVEAQLPAELTATIASSRAAANVAQPFTVTLTLTNGGEARADLTAVQLGTTGAAASCGEPTPALPRSIATGGVLRLEWTCTGSAPGALSLTATATGTDATGAPLSVTPASPAQVAVQTAAALSATLAVQGSPISAVVGQTLSVTLTVSDAGQAGASVTAVQPTVTPASRATCEPPAPAPPRTVAGLGSRTFTWSCTALTAGSLSLGATVAGADANTGAALQATAPAVPLTVVLPAALTATIAASRATVDVGQPVTVTFTLTNGGAATANVTAVTPSRTGTATANCNAPTPTPAPIPAGGSSTFTWTCTATTAGTLVLSGTATGTDAVSGAPISAMPATSASVTVQTPAALAASLAVQGSPTTILVGQTLSVTLTVSDTGQAGASVTTVQPSVTPTSGATCGTPTPAPPQTIAGLGSRTFTWSCTALAAGSLSLGASVSGTDANTGATVQATAPGVSLSVLVPASLTATISGSRSTANVGQAVTATFTLTNGGTSTANVASITPTTTGTASASCTAPTPAPTAILAGGSSTFTWTCTATTAGTLILSGTAIGTDEISGAPISATPGTSASVTVQTPTALAAALVGLPTTVTVGQAVGLTLTVQNTGGAAALVSSVVPEASGTAVASCGAVTPSIPLTIPGGASATFSWSCTPSSAGALTLGASVGAADSNTGADASPMVAPVGATVQLPSQLTATLTGSTTSITLGGSVTLTLVIQNDGQATARVASVAPSNSPGGSNITCDRAVSPAPPQDVAAQTAVSFTWSCTPQRATTFTLGATVTATDLGTGQPLAVTVPTVLVTAI